MWNISSVLTENYKYDIVSIVRFIPYLKIQKLNCISPFHPTDYKCQLLSGINRSHRGYGSKIRKWPCLLGLLAWLLSTAASWRHDMERHLYYWPLVMVMPWRLCDVTVMFWDSIHEAMLIEVERKSYNCYTELYIVYRSSHYRLQSSSIVGPMVRNSIQAIDWYDNAVLVNLAYCNEAC